MVDTDTDWSMEFENATTAQTATCTYVQYVSHVYFNARVHSLTLQQGRTRMTLWEQPTTQESMNNANTFLLPPPELF